jgi:hypothetical protein
MVAAGNRWPVFAGADSNLIIVTAFVVAVLLSTIYRSGGPVQVGRVPRMMLSWECSGFPSSGSREMSTMR